MFIKKKLHEFKPTDRFFFNVHLDGLEETHDLAVEREGVFKAAVEGIVAAKKAGFLVCTNTTIFKETDLGEIDRLFAYLTKLGVDGFLLSPAYGYTAVQETNPDGAAEIFMTRDDIRAKFKEAEKLFYKYRMMSSPVYLEFLSGKRELTCTAWGNPTRNIKGWKGPCYLITDEHHDTLPRPDGRHAVGELRPRQGPALRALHGALRLRAVGGAGRQRQARRQPQDADVAAVVKCRFTCTKTYTPPGPFPPAGRPFREVQSSTRCGIRWFVVICGNYCPESGKKSSRRATPATRTTLNTLPVRSPT